MTVLDDIKSRAYTAADTDKRWLIGEVDALTDKCTFQVGLTKLAMADVERLERIDRVTVEALASSRAEFERLKAENKELHNAISGPTRLAGGVPEVSSDPEVDSTPDPHPQDSVDIHSLRATDNLNERWTTETKLVLLDEIERLEAAMNRWLKEYDHPMPSYFRDALRSTGDGA